MQLKWTSRSQDDLGRLYAFLAEREPSAAKRAIERVIAAAARLPAHPRIGERLEEFDPREVRRVFTGRSELRYEIRTASIFVLRVWHAREER